MQVGRVEVTQEAHAAYYLRLAEMAEPELYGVRSKLPWFDRLEREYDNLRVAHAMLARARKGVEMALRLGSALYWFWLMRESLREGMATSWSRLLI